MSTLGEEREAIKDAVTGARPGLDVFTFMPDRLAPPAAFITTSDPYLERRDGDPFGHVTAAWEVWIVERSGTNAKVTDQLDTDIEKVCQKLHSAGFAVERVDEPFMYTVQNASYLATVVHVTTGVTFTN